MKFLHMLHKIINTLLYAIAVAISWSLMAVWLLMLFASPIWFNHVVVPLVPDAGEGTILMLCIGWIAMAAFIVLLDNRVEDFGKRLSR